MKEIIKYKILTFLMWGFGFIFVISLFGVIFEYEPLSEAATQDMGNFNRKIFQEREYDSVYTEIYNLERLEFKNQENVWCKAEELYSLMYVPGLDSWIWTGLGNEVFRPYQKYGFHSYEAQKWECTESPLYVLIWRVENAVKFGFFGTNYPLNR